MDRQFEYISEKGKIPYYFCEPKNIGTLQFYEKDFSEYNRNKANCSLFYIMLLASAHNDTFNSIAQFYTGPDEVYSDIILAVLRNKYNGTNNMLSELLFNE